MNNFRILTLISFFVLVGWNLEVCAHQPRLVDAEKINITNPEISKAYYGKLSGKPHTYIINTSSAIDLYVNVLVPFIEGPGKNVTVKIFKGAQNLGNLIPGKEDWETFFEPFGQSMYWKGPEFKQHTDAGKYKILVESNEKNIRYVLATGEIEAFDGKEGLRAILLIPELKKNFFEESPISFIFSPLGWGYILILQLLALLLGLIISRILKIRGINIQRKYIQKFPKNKRIWSLIFWFGLLSWAVSTSWHPLLILTSGLALFILLNSWYGYKVSKMNKA